jgi:hypothetical protein
MPGFNGSRAHQAPGSAPATSTLMKQRTRLTQRPPHPPTAPLRNRGAPASPRSPQAGTSPFVPHGQVPPFTPHPIAVTAPAYAGSRQPLFIQLLKSAVAHASASPRCVPPFARRTATRHATQSAGFEECRTGILPVCRGIEVPMSGKRKRLPRFGRREQKLKSTEA